MSIAADSKFNHFLLIAIGSATEPEYRPLIRRDPGFLNDSDDEHLARLATNVKQMTASFIQKLKADP